MNGPTHGTGKRPYDDGPFDPADVVVEAAAERLRADGARG
jgi:hypothetical protein